MQKSSGILRRPWGPPWNEGKRNEGERSAVVSSQEVVVRKTRNAGRSLPRVAGGLFGFAALLGCAAVSAQLAELVADLAPQDSTQRASFSTFQPIRGRAVFSVGGAGLASVFGSDGAAVGTVELPVRGSFRARLSGSLLYGGGRDLWRTDGTVAGSWRLAVPGLAEYSGVANDSVAELDDGTVLILSRDGLVVSQGAEDDARLVDLQLPSVAEVLVGAGSVA